jgi:hypothetical protein
MAKKGRNYAQEAKWQDRPENRARQAARMRARRKLEKEGRVRPHDGKEVDHKDFNPKNNSRKNLRVMSRSANRKKQPKHKS